MTDSFALYKLIILYMLEKGGFSTDHSTDFRIYP